MTTPQIIPLTHCVDMALIARLFVRYKGRYGGLWTCRASNDEEWQWIMEDWLAELSKFTLGQVRGAVNKSLSEFTKAPPTLPELIQLCMKESGFPDAHEVIRLMVNRDFSHPLVKLVYDKVGSWTLSNGKADEIERKVKEHYTACKSEFYVEPKKSWEALESFNAKPKELPQPSKIPTAGESKAFREFMNKCQEMLKSKTTHAGGKTYKHFDENKIKKGCRDFDPEVHQEFCDYLLSIEEKDTIILPPTYAYERMKLIAKREQPEMLRKSGYNPNPQAQDKVAPRSSNGRPTRIYKNWGSD